MMALLILAVPSDAKKKVKKQALWPNGEVISEWFMDTVRVDVSTLGRQYVITDYGVVQDSTKLQTEAIQKVIDRAAQDGGGVVVFPKGNVPQRLPFLPSGHPSAHGRGVGAERH